MTRHDAIKHGWIVANSSVRGLRVAFCLDEYLPDGLSYLFAQVASIRFNAVRFFSNLENAMRWLQR